MFKVLINNGEMNPICLTYSEWKFGRRRGDSVKYTLQLQLSDFIQKFQPIYEEGMKEWIEDDKITGVFDPLYEGATNYPTFEEFLNLSENQQLEMFDFRCYFFGVLACYLKEESEHKEVKWIINSLNNFSIHGQKVLIGGQAIDIKSMHRLSYTSTQA